MRTMYLTLLLMLLMQITFAQNKRSVNQNTKLDSINRKISVDEFEKKLLITPDAQLIDVRTPTEYSEGHLKNARNMDINSPQFVNEVSKLDKKRAIMIYCLSGGRSTVAANKMAAMGFSEIYNMDGGIIRWLNSGKGVTGASGAQSNKGLTLEALNTMVKQKKWVLVDYNAKWCEPCKRMLPYLESLAVKKKEKLLFINVDVDANKQLLKEKGIGEFPYLEFYEDGNLKWKNKGYIDEDALLVAIGL